jgi:hypothetical protein
VKAGGKQRTKRGDDDEEEDLSYLKDALSFYKSNCVQCFLYA